MKTKVIFLIDKPFNPDFDPQVFAYFPDDICDYNGNRTSYSHIGQHSACCPDYANECNQASAEQYGPLMSELQSIGYELEVINK